MFTATEPVIRNIKVGFRYNTETRSVNDIKGILTRLESKHLHNFSVLRSCYVYTIFWTGGYVNITGIRNRSEIDKSEKHIMNLMKLNTEDITQQLEVHNICASGTFSKIIDLERTRKYIKHNTSHRVTLNLEYFPALFIRIKKLGTCVLYRNGKYSLMAIRQFNQVEEFIKYLLMKKLCIFMKI